MRGIRYLQMRGGTSKGAYFLAQDLPSDRWERADLLLRIMGTPDPRQIDGIGGAHPLTSKVALVSPSGSDEADVDYLFLQIGVEQATVSDAQNCGNLLAGVGPFAVERGLVAPGAESTSTRIRMVNSDSLAIARFPTPGGEVQYSGEAEISGVPGTAAPILLDFAGTAGSATGALLPTGRITDVVSGIEVSCVDNGMPVVVVRAEDLGVTGYESPQELSANEDLLERVRSLRLRAGELMGLGDVGETSVPKTTLVASPQSGGVICTRTFIPTRPHEAIGVLGALSVGTALLIPGAVGCDLAVRQGQRLVVEHPTGALTVDVDVDTEAEPPRVRRSSVLRTARKLCDGTVFPRPSSVSNG